MMEANMETKTKAQADLDKARDDHKAAQDAVKIAAQAESDAKPNVAALEGTLAKADDAGKPAAQAAVKEAKSKHTAAVKNHKSAVSGETKAQKAVEKAQKAVTAESEKTAKANAAQAAKEEKAKQAEQAKQAAKQPTQNDVTRPKADSATGKAWAIFDDVSKARGEPASIGEALPKATAAGINEATCRTQYARWRKFNNVSGRVENPTAVKAETAVTGDGTGTALPAAPPPPPAPAS